MEAIWLAAIKPNVGGEIFQISTGVEHSLHALTEALRHALTVCGLKAVPVHHEAIRLGDIVRNFADPSKAERMLGWKAAVPLSEGLARTVRWFTDKF